eukprot:TRINITY_DN11678_c0_g5_i1.p2 TRINITY_DN11678_c0_g5~~TRINITY_DN11678_c0_g5_i1.p2  ORF type:complete len:139 (-),score=18.33 TRINITY_DN11678_c0_g5_i1:193-609(-)
MTPVSSCCLLLLAHSVCVVANVGLSSQATRTNSVDMQRRALSDLCTQRDTSARFPCNLECAAGKYCQPMLGGILMAECIVDSCTEGRLQDGWHCADCGPVRCANERLVEVASCSADEVCSPSGDSSSTVPCQATSVGR